MEMENHKFNPRCDPTNYNANLAQPNERGEGEYRERRHTHTEKTYSEVTRSSRDNTESTRPAWSSPPPQAKKLETIIQIPNENNPNTVLKEIKQNISEEQIDSTFKRMRKLSNWAVLLESYNPTQQQLNALEKNSQFIIKQTQNIPK